LHVDGLGYVDVRRPVLELRPASNQKVVTAVGALELLPKEFRFVTVMRLDEDRRLYVQAGGDPTLTQADVRGMIDDVVAYLAPPSDQPVPEAAPADPEEDSGGVVVESRPPVEIADLVIDPSYFDDTRTAPGWPDRYVPVDVGPMSALIIDDNQHRGDDDFIADPDRGNAELISALLEDAGVVVTGSVSVGPTSPDAVVVAEHRSSPLRRLVSLILSTSDNEIADALVRQIARDHAGTSSIVDGKQVIYDRVAALGVELGPVDGDGSGLSRRNRLSARELVEVLLVARERPWWTIMRTGLANARVDVRLSERLEVTTPLGNVRAKTGTLIDVAALSGDLTTADGGEVTFSLIIEAEDRDAARDALDEIVAALTTATVSQLAG
ncbi:MAG: D-alanyl-D-alanine carboxypeptidase/D-alanyl-D-alanine-endopeptidase, partial [Actinomycetota bacterium]